MMKITLISVGKIKDKNMMSLVQEYEKRLSRFCKFCWLQIKDEPERGTNQEDLNIIKRIEGERMIKTINPNSTVIALDLKGKALTSEDIAQELDAYQTKGTSHLTLLIGGSNGFSEDVFNHIQTSWSFSKLTFPHQLMPLLLIEQLYRAFKINANESYHK